MTADRFSRAAFSEPGRLMIRLRPRVPATARDNMARGVIFSPSIHMATGMARISRSSTARVASGVTSRGERPVPPAVMIATRKGGTAVRKGDKLAGMRVIPLIIAEEKLRKAEQAAGEAPLLALVMALSLAACGNKTDDTQKIDDQTPAETVELTVFAAASLTESLTAIGEKYMAENENVKISFNFDSSGKLYTQIAEGAPCDLFISAAPKQMNQLDGTLKDDADKNPGGLDMLVEGSRIDLLENKVALAVAEGNDKGIDSFDKLVELLKSGDVMLAIGNSDVPVGQYTQKIFAYYEIDEAAVADKLTYGSNVKEVTTAVSEGTVDCGIIYASDAYSAGLTVAATATAEMCGQVIYPAAVLDSFLKWNLELELSDLLSDFKGPILWVSHDLGECYRNCRSVCVMENGVSGAVTDMETLVQHPATAGAVRLAGCRNFLPAARCDGGVKLNGWDILLPLQAAGEAVTVAIPDEAVRLTEGEYTAVVHRVLRDLHASVVLLRLANGAEEPLLRAVLPEGVAAAGGETVRFGLLTEKCLCC